ncbi:unnamed protein product, partial [Didymodactylos carnosus]
MRCPAGTKPNSLNSLFCNRIILLNPDTKKEVVELYQHRLPLLCLACCQEQIRTVSSDNAQLLGLVRRG